MGALVPLPIGMQFRLRISHDMRTCELHGKVIYLHSGCGLGIFGMGVLIEKIAADRARSVIDAWRSCSRPEATCYTPATDLIPAPSNFNRTCLRTDVSRALFISECGPDPKRQLPRTPFLGTWPVQLLAFSY